MVTKTIRDFVLSKVRRAELSDELTEVEVEAAIALRRAELGRLEVAIADRRGDAVTPLEFYAGAFVADGENALRYEDIRRIVLAQQDTNRVIIFSEMATFTFERTRPEATVLFATLRWIGHAILRRDLVHPRTQA
ncbi:MAG: hypothetical protein H6729_07265 [Deltaproteobacteria bacterium]|nr:hypothetical protein [Deltaproteobacteria bacterium]